MFSSYYNFNYRLAGSSRPQQTKRAQKTRYRLKRLELLFCRHQLFALLFPGKTLFFSTSFDVRHSRLFSTELFSSLFQVLNKWGEYSQDVQFILQRSALDGAKNPAAPSGAVKSGPMSPQMQRNYPAGIRPPAVSGGGLLAKAPAGIVEPPAVWKPPPPGYPPPQPRKGGFNNNPTAEGARLSPDSGRGSDKTGSDTSNSYTDNKDNMKNNNSKAKIPQTSHPYPMMNGGSGSYNYNNNVHRSVSASHMLWRLPPPGASGLPPPPHDSESPYGFTKQTSMPVLQKQHPPAYKPPPNPVPTSSSSPADPPPYREPPPAPGIRYRTPSSPKTTVRPPHYSPPPTHKTHLSRHPSKSSLVAASGVGAAVRPPYLRGKAVSSNDPPTDMTELLNLVTAQQSTLQAQQADMRQVGDIFFSFSKQRK